MPPIMATEGPQGTLGLTPSAGTSLSEGDSVRKGCSLQARRAEKNPQMNSRGLPGGDAGS